MKRTSKAAGAASPRTAADVDEYLASVPADKRAALARLRKAISAAAPRAEEGSSYGLPAFRLNGRPLVCFGAAAHHCSLFPMSPAVIRAHAADLGLRNLKGNDPVPPEEALTRVARAEDRQGTDRRVENASRKK